MEFQVRYLASFLLLSVTDGFKWFLMESLNKNIQLRLKFLKVPFVVLHFSCHTLMTFLMMLSITLPSVLMIRLLICGNNLNQIYKALWTGIGSCLLISMLGKLGWFRLTGLITMVLLMQKWMGLFLRKNYLLRCLG